MKAIYSARLYDDSNFECGFRDFKHFIAFLRVSVEHSKRLFGKVVFYTTTHTWEKVKDYGLPFDEVDTSFDAIAPTVNDSHWALIKLWACQKQTEPFVHIDNDAMLRHSVWEGVKNTDCFFQSKEDGKHHHGYKEAILELKYQRLNKDLQIVRDIKEHGVRPDVFFAFNCGVIGFNRVPEGMLQSLWESAYEACRYFDDLDEAKPGMPRSYFSRALTTEQLNMWMHVKKWELTVSYTLADENWKGNYMHLAADTKREEYWEGRIRDWLLEVDPELHNRLFSSSL